MNTEAIKTKEGNKARIAYLRTLNKALMTSGMGKEERKVARQEIEKNRKEIKFLMSNKQFLYNFKSGGWNSGSGRTIEEAIKAEKKRWGKNSSLEMDLDSFRLKTDEEEKMLLSLFY
jgi:hypothetical protein